MPQHGCIKYKLCQCQRLQILVCVWGGGGGYDSMRASVSDVKRRRELRMGYWIFEVVRVCSVDSLKLKR